MRSGRYLLFLMMIACATRAWSQAALPATEVEAVVTTDLGTFRFEFAPDKAPKHVEQFLARARQGYYDGSAFHRVVANGIIQGGDPLLKNLRTPKAQWGTGGLNLLPNEFSDMKHERGVVSTVSIPGRANSEGAQFFVCVSPATGARRQVYYVRPRHRRGLTWWRRSHRWRRMPMASRKNRFAS